MFCVKCGKEVKEGTKFCTNCGAEMEEKKEEKLSYSQNQSIPTTTNTTPVAAPASTGDGKGTASLVLGIVSLLIWCVTPITAIVGLILGICAKKSGKKTAGIILNAIALGLFVVVSILAYSLGFVAAWTDSTGTSTPTITIPGTSGINYSTNQITFEGFKMTFGKNFEIVKDTKSTYSSNYGKDVIKLPVTVENVSATSDHLNMYHYDFYGPDGETIASLRSDFGSAVDAIDYVHVSRGNSKVQYFYIEYKGDGKYTIKFHNYNNETAEVSFTIKK